MNWLRRMLHHETEIATPVVTPQDHYDLEDAKQEHRRLLSRADDAIQAAMAHADAVFGYHGTERRKRPR